MFVYKALVCWSLATSMTWGRSFSGVRVLFLLDYQQTKTSESILSLDCKSRMPRIIGDIIDNINKDVGFELMIPLQFSFARPVLNGKGDQIDKLTFPFGRYEISSNLYSYFLQLGEPNPISDHVVCMRGSRSVPWVINEEEDQSVGPLRYSKSLALLVNQIKTDKTFWPQPSNPWKLIIVGILNDTQYTEANVRQIQKTFDDLLEEDIVWDKRQKSDNRQWIAHVVYRIPSNSGGPMGQARGKVAEKLCNAEQQRNELYERNGVEYVRCYSQVCSNRLPQTAVNDMRYCLPYWNKMGIKSEWWKEASYKQIRQMIQRTVHEASWTQDAMLKCMSAFMLLMLIIICVQFIVIVVAYRRGEMDLMYEWLLPADFNPLHAQHGHHHANKQDKSSKMNQSTSQRLPDKEQPVEAASDASTSQQPSPTEPSTSEQSTLPTSQSSAADASKTESDQPTEETPDSGSGLGDSELDDSQQ